MFRVAIADPSDAVEAAANEKASVRRHTLVVANSPFA
jgi:hypothetical protein